MKKLAILLVAAIGAMTPTFGVVGQNIMEFSCIGTLTAACSGTLGASLRNYSSGSLKYASVAGYFAPGDSGGGSYFNLGLTGMGGTACLTPAVSGTGEVASSRITNTSPHHIAGLVPGELVTVSGSDIQSQPGTELASYNSNTNNINLTLPLTGTVSGSQPVTLIFTSDNGGTLIVDAGRDCWQKTNYRGDPHEFGAYGDGQTDDTQQIQRWLGAYGNAVTAGPSATLAPTNFGPWFAAVPASYLVSQPLFCPPNATIRGDENLENNDTGDQVNFNPRVNFIASSTFSGFTYLSAPTMTGSSGSQAVFGAFSHCRLSSIAVTGNAFNLPTTGTTHGSTTIDGLGSISGVQVGNPVTGNDVPADTVVTALGSCMNMGPPPTNCSVTISQATTGMGATEDITFYGPDAVDALDNRLTIDNFSLLNNGRYNLYCGFLQGSGATAKSGDMSIKDSSLALNPGISANRGSALFAAMGVLYSKRPSDTTKNMVRVVVSTN
jgi:hypothetical protein